MKKFTLAYIIRFGDAILDGKEDALAVWKSKCEQEDAAWKNEIKAAEEEYNRHVNDAEWDGVDRLMKVLENLTNE